MLDASSGGDVDARGEHVAFAIGSFPVAGALATLSLVAVECTASGPLLIVRS